MIRSVQLLLFFLVLLAAGASQALLPYDMGNPTLSAIWVDPVRGNDSNDGSTPAEAVRTITRAWALVPASLMTTGYSINLLPGAYPCEPGPEADNCINYFAGRNGAYQFPIIIRAAAGPGTVTIRGGFDLNDVHYLYLLDLDMVGGAPLPTNNSGNNLLHLAGSDHILLRGLTLAGPACANDSCNNLQEVLKANQVRHLYVEECAIGGAWHTSVDYMVVQYGHLLNNRLHTAGQWCMYVKGGSAYLWIEGNELSGCQLGFEAGQAANMAMMVTPWLHYDAYDIKFINNVLHDIPGVGMAVAGGYNILFAFNTLYRVGISSDPGYGLMQFSQGERGCSATDDLPDPLPACTARTGAGGWGPNFLSDSMAAIPNRKVYVYNNLFYNDSSQTLYSHMGVNGAINPPAGFMNIATPVRADDHLVIRGNLIWNGPPDLPLGIEDAGQGCQPDNPTCNAAQLRADNTINTMEPRLIDPAHGDFHPLSGGNLFNVTTFTIPDFTWSDSPAHPAVPRGTLSNAVVTDRDGSSVAVSPPPGSYRTSAGCMVKRLFATQYEYASTPAEAYAKVAADYESILLREGAFAPMLFGRPWRVSFRGGFGAGFTGNAGTFSTVSGSVTIVKGSVTVENIVVQ